jgi:hypothetical protein
MAFKEFDYLAAANEASERIAEPLRRARILFKTISGELGVPSAKLIFQLCAQEAVEPCTAESKPPRREQMKLPTIAQIEGASRAKICTLWERLRHTDQQFNNSEKKIIGQLAARYVEVGGYPTGYVEGKLPPIKKRGAVKRDAVNAALPELFKALKIEHPRLSNLRIAEIVVERYGKRYGKNAEAVDRTERNWRGKKNRKV